MARTNKDPTGQKKNRRKTFRAIRKRLREARDAIIRDVEAIPFDKVRQKKIQNATLTMYMYDLSGSDLENLRLSVQSHLRGHLGAAAESMPEDWWYKKEIELPFRQGTLEELNEIGQMLQSMDLGSPLISTTVDPTSVLLSPSYLDGVREAQVRNYGLIQSLGRDTAKQVYNVIESGIQGGEPIRNIKAAIRERFGVSESSAKRIASTEVNRSYNDARLRAVKQVRDKSEADMGVLHISSLLQTTRATHAARHGNAYTPEQQTRWWNEGANRINCHCTTRTVVFQNGEVVQSELQKRVKDQRE